MNFYLFAFFSHTIQTECRCVFSAITKLIRVSRLGCYFLVILFSDVMTIHFFFLVCILFLFHLSAFSYCSGCFMLVLCFDFCFNTVVKTVKMEAFSIDSIHVASNTFSDSFHPMKFLKVYPFLGIEYFDIINIEICLFLLDVATWATSPNLVRLLEEIVYQWSGFSG